MPEVRLLRGSPADAAALAGLSSPGELQRAARSRAAVDRNRSLVGAALLRRAAADLTGSAAQDVRIGRWCRSCARLGDHGRPVALDPGGRPDPGVHLSASHAGDVVLVAATTAGPVGVDVERAAGVGFEGFDDAVLTGRERERLLALPAGDREEARARTWTRKEAVLKATGHGLAVAPARVDLADWLDPGADPGHGPGPLARPPRARWPAELDADLRPGRVHLLDLAVPAGHVASLCLLAAAPPVPVERS